MRTRADRRWAALERHRRNGRRRGAVVVLLALASLGLVVLGAVLSGCELPDTCHPIRLECRPPAPPPFPDGATPAHWGAPTVPDGGALHVHPAADAGA
jgi:hypothetical protein